MWHEKKSFLRPRCKIAVKNHYKSSLKKFVGLEFVVWWFDPMNLLYENDFLEWGQFLQSFAEALVHMQKFCQNCPSFRKTIEFEISFCNYVLGSSSIRTCRIQNIFFLGSGKNQNKYLLKIRQVNMDELPRTLIKTY